MKCFLSGVVVGSTNGIRVALGAAGIDIVEYGSIAVGADLNSWLVTSVEESDLVIIALPPTAPDPAAIMVEIGVALGLRKPVLILAPKDRESPSALAGLRYVRADLDDAEAIALHIRALQKSIPEHREAAATPTARRSTEPQSEVAAWLTVSLHQLRQSSGIERNQLLESIVSSLFERAGGLVETAPRTDDGPDLAVMFGADSATPGVLLVEAKATYAWRPLEQAMLQLERYVADRGAQLGVLIYWSPKLSVRPPDGSPRVLALDLAELPGRLEEQSLAELLAAERNRKVHGM